MMESGKVFHILVIAFSLTLATTPSAYGWGYEGHKVVCRIAQARLTKAAATVVKKLLPAPAKGDLGMVCPWADQVKFKYRWSSSLHFINTPDRICSYSYARDCKDKRGVKDRCLAGAIHNYTKQLINYRVKGQPYNLTESLMFLSHFMGDIHQPLHVGFASDRGGNAIKVKWFNRTTELHHVWDTDVIKQAQGKGANATNIYGFISNIQQKINRQWAKQIKGWGACKPTCTNVYAEESIKAACEWAYKGVVQSRSILADNYFNTRLPTVEVRLAQAGVRLAATLNQIFT